MCNQAPLSFVGVGELAETLGAQTWRISRLFEDGTLPEPPRVGGRRMIPKSQVPAVVDALRERNWLPTEEPARV